MHIRDILVYGSAFILPVVNSRSIFDWGSEEVPIIDSPGDFVPGIIGLQTDTTLTRPAEVATLDVYVSASAPSESEAFDEATAAAERVSRYLAGIESQTDSPIESFKSFPIRAVRSREYDDDEELYRLRDYDFDGFEISSRAGDDTLDHDGKTKSYKAKTRFSVRIERPRAVADFKKDITTSIPIRMTSETGQVTSHDVKVSHITWELTDSSKADFKRELRAKAVANTVHEAQDYAFIHSKEALRPLECEEMWTYVYEKYDWRHDDDFDRESVEPRDIEGEISMKCKFRLE